MCWRTDGCILQPEEVASLRIAGTCRFPYSSSDYVAAIRAQLVCSCVVCRGSWNYFRNFPKPALCRSLLCRSGCWPSRNRPNLGLQHTLHSRWDRCWSIFLRHLSRPFGNIPNIVVVVRHTSTAARDVFCNSIYADPPELFHCCGWKPISSCDRSDGSRDDRLAEGGRSV